MNRIIVCGGCGKMASLVATQIHLDSHLELFAVIESPEHPALGKDWGMFMGMGELNIPIKRDLGETINECDVVVDFTTPAATMEHLKSCVDARKPMVVGTTALSNEQVQEITSAASDIPIVMSPNMSLGINLLFELVKNVAGILDDEYDIEIIETHHRFKKDAPSGTAKKIAEIIAKEKGILMENSAVYGRYGNDSQRKTGEIGIHAVRAGNINGEHRIIFNSLGERIELSHQAYGRDAFAHGTIKAIHFIINKTNGLYSMKEVLNL